MLLQKAIKTNLSFFIALSILWHGLLLLLFSTVFKISQPVIGDRQSTLPLTATIASLQTEVFPLSREKPEEAAEERSDVLEEMTQEALVQPLSKPRLLQRKRVRPDKSVKKVFENDMPVELSRESSSLLPFHFGEQLQKRRVIYKPTLPAYPESARNIGLNLNLKLVLLVDRDGKVLAIDVKKSSGDSKTDDVARRYASELVFEASTEQSRGIMVWEFRLE